jgi:putative transposase
VAALDHRDRASPRAHTSAIKLVISDAHEGLKAAATKVLSAPWQRCRVHFMRNALAHVGTKQRPMVAAAIRTAFTQETAEAALNEWRAVADRLRDRFRKLAELMDEAEHDVLAHMAFPKDHWQQLHSTNPLERLNGEIKRRTDVVAIFPNENSIVRLVGALLLEQSDEWAVQRRYMSLETLDGLCDDAARRPRKLLRHDTGPNNLTSGYDRRFLHHHSGHDREPPPPLLEIVVLGAGPGGWREWRLCTRRDLRCSG